MEILGKIRASSRYSELVTAGNCCPKPPLVLIQKSLALRVTQAIQSDQSVEWCRPKSYVRKFGGVRESHHPRDAAFNQFWKPKLHRQIYAPSECLKHG
jgi:hypothetical protein